MESILNVSERVQLDESIAKLNYHVYTPYNSMSLNNSDEIRVVVNSQDIITLPTKSYLYIRGSVTNHDKCTFSNNAFAHLFSELRYEVASKEVDYVKNVGVTSSMKGVCSWNSEEAKRKHFTDIKVGSKFSICLPLSSLSGFFEDFDKVLINVKQELILKRAASDKNLYYMTGAEAVAVKLDAVEWHVPHIVPSDEEKLNLNRILLNNKTLEMKFRSWELHEYPTFPQTTKHTWSVKTTTGLERPRFIIFGFKTKRESESKKDFFLFDNCELKNFKVYLNSEFFPYQDLKLNFTDNDTALLYEMYCKFQEAYYNKPNEPLYSYNDFISKTPIVVVDTSYQTEAIKQTVVDLKLEIETNTNVPADTSAYCLIIHNKELEYNPFTSDIRKM